MKRTNQKIRSMAFCALLAALYTVASLAIPAASFGMMQLRLGEIFTLFAAATPLAIPALTLGCFLTNLIGLFLGLTFPPDLLFGTLATFLAAVCSYLLRRVRFRNVPFLIWLPPVFFNGLLVGLELTLFALPAKEEASFALFLITAFYVALGELLVCLLAGMPFYLVAEKRLHLNEYSAF